MLSSKLVAPYKKIYSFPNSSYGTEYHLEIMASCDGEKQPMEVPQIKKVCTKFACICFRKFEVVKFTLAISLFRKILLILVIHISGPPEQGRGGGFPPSSAMFFCRCFLFYKEPLKCHFWKKQPKMNMKINILYE